eukprot:TRINITY_DN83_c2_g1_i2.p1 TRINITY_DN83_c2_g1~~TRINITY_DN83_c2_g1_i2.p1  ORF type:complete len:146 (-),score=57.45 TRINITY_DN83_c2_g1_i2:537-974(-)
MGDARGEEIVLNRSKAGGRGAGRGGGGGPAGGDQKFGGGGNKAKPTTDLRKLEKQSGLDEDESSVNLKVISREVAQAIQKGRSEKKLTQTQLAQKINERESVVKDYERCIGTPNQQILAKMERALGIKLRGAGVGDPIEPRHPKK